MAKKENEHDDKPDQSLPGGGRRPHPDHDLPGEGKPSKPDQGLPGAKPKPTPTPLPTDEVEIVVGDEVITITLGERQFQITHEGRAFLHKGEDAEGRWVYQPAQ